MTGLIVLGFLVAYVAIATGIASWAKGRWRLLVIAVFILIPTWDIVPGKIALAHYCEKEGGIKIYRSVDGVEGFLSLDGRAYKDYFKRYGYKYVEIERQKRDPRTGKAMGKEYARVTLGGNDNLREELVDKPISNYEFKDYRNDETYSSPWGITLFSASIIDRNTGETIAVDKRFGWYGGWLRKLNRPILGAGHGCGTVGDSYGDILQQTLIPVNDLGYERKHG